MKKILLAALFYLFVANSFSQSFITTWNTGADNYIVIPGTGTNYNIVWEEIGNPSHNGSKIATDLDTVKFGTYGNYKVSISGGSPAFNRIFFGNILYTEASKLITVQQWGSILWATMYGAFWGCENLSTVPTNSQPNLSLATNMSLMFSDCHSFNSDISNWDVSQITDMSYLFSYAYSFNKPLNSWNTANVINMSNMFSEDSSFNQSLNSWNTSNVTNMFEMFGSSKHFNQNISNWNTVNVTNMSRMFVGASLFNQPLNSWNTSNVINMSGMFYEARAFNQPLNSWNTIKVTDMSYMFSSAIVFNQPLNSWNTSNVTNMKFMFCNATVFNQAIGSWNTSQVADMSSMFNLASNFNQAIGNWNTSNVTNMNSMFTNAIVFNQPIGNWNTINVVDMGSLFTTAAAFNQPIGNWDVGNVKTMFEMFRGVYNFNQSISGWNTSNVTNMSQMFLADTLFNQPIGNWNTSKVTNMQGMFYNAFSFNQSIGNWNISNTTDISYLFAFAKSYNQEMKNWNTNKVIDMTYTFYKTSSFNQNISSWNVANILATNRIDLGYSAISQQFYDSILISWSNQSVKSGVRIFATNLLYCNAQSQRNMLINSKGVIISGDALAPGCTLPITFTSFTATPQENKVNLQWQTATETNNAYFTVQKSNNSNNWETVATVKGNGNSSTLKTYNAIDSKPFSGISYYRIKQTDNNGNYTFSTIKQVNLSTNQPINIYPNPARDIVNISCAGTKEIKIINQLGQIVYTKVFQSPYFGGVGEAVNTKQLPKGIYAVVVETAKGIVTKTLVKE